MWFTIERLPRKKKASIYKENESKRKGVQHMGNEKVLGYSIKCAKDTKKKILQLWNDLPGEVFHINQKELIYFKYKKYIF